MKWGTGRDGTGSAPKASLSLGGPFTPTLDPNAGLKKIVIKENYFQTGNSPYTSVSVHGWGNVVRDKACSRKHVSFG